jgi:hypothetical protein
MIDSSLINQCNTPSQLYGNNLFSVKITQPFYTNELGRFRRVRYGRGRAGPTIPTTPRDYSMFFDGGAEKNWKFFSAPPSKNMDQGIFLTREQFGMTYESN